MPPPGMYGGGGGMYGGAVPVPIVNSGAGGGGSDSGKQQQQQQQSTNVIVVGGGGGGGANATTPKIETGNSSKQATEAETETEPETIGNLLLDEWNQQRIGGYARFVWPVDVDSDDDDSHSASSDNDDDSFSGIGAPVAHYEDDEDESFVDTAVDERDNVLRVGTAYEAAKEAARHALTCMSLLHQDDASLPAHLEHYIGAQFQHTVAYDDPLSLDEAEDAWARIHQALASHVLACQQ